MAVHNTGLEAAANGRERAQPSARRRLAPHLTGVAHNCLTGTAHHIFSARSEEADRRAILHCVVSSLKLAIS